MKTVFAEKYPAHAEEVKAFRKAHGDKKVGEITVDMVSITFFQHVFGDFSNKSSIDNSTWIIKKDLLHRCTVVWEEWRDLSLKQAY